MVSFRHLFVKEYRNENTITIHWQGPLTIYKLRKNVGILLCVRSHHFLYWCRFFAELENNLNSHVFGQHIATETIVIALQSHFRKRERQKPLVFSFHGWPGGGKGFVGSFIIKSIFKNGEESKFVKKYLSRIHFPLYKEVHTYQVRQMLFADL